MLRVVDALPHPLGDVSASRNLPFVHMRDMVLCDLTDGDLEKIGVSLGHRKRLLKAVAALAGPAAAPPAATPIPVAAAAERRQLTVMFSDTRRLDRAVG